MYSPLFNTQNRLSPHFHLHLCREHVAWVVSLEEGTSQNARLPLQPASE